MAFGLDDFYSSLASHFEDFIASIDIGCGAGCVRTKLRAGLAPIIADAISKRLAAGIPAAEVAAETQAALAGPLMTMIVPFGADDDPSFAQDVIGDAWAIVNGPPAPPPPPIVAPVSKFAGAAATKTVAAIPKMKLTERRPPKATAPVDNGGEGTIAPADVQSGFETLGAVAVGGIVVVAVGAIALPVWLVLKRKGRA